jgi:cob(I)alamin adenosyltransferase
MRSGSLPLTSSRVLGVCAPASVVGGSKLSAVLPHLRPRWSGASSARPFVLPLAARSISASSMAAAKKSGLYTRTGDKGTTSLYDGSRAPKDSPVFTVLGTLDELSAHLGLAVVHCRKADNNALADELEAIQCRCMDMASAVATPRPKEGAEETRKHLLTAFESEHLQELEQRIDAMDAALPALKKFVVFVSSSGSFLFLFLLLLGCRSLVLTSFYSYSFVIPSGGLAACTLHVARVVTRRVERELWPLIRDGSVEEEVGAYVNRLSDFFFAAARTAAVHEGAPETKYEVAKRKASSVTG